MLWTRREVLAAGTAGLAVWAARGDEAAAPPRMGVVLYSYGIRRGAEKDGGFAGPMLFVAYCRQLGAGGAQTALGVRDDDYADKLREYCEHNKLYLEGIISAPRDRDDVDRFADEVRTAKRCGAGVFRTALLNGRRYETFDSAEAFGQFVEQGKQSLALARPVVEKHEVRMAVENHKDLRSPELLDVLKKLDCPLVGVCLDTGNSIALLEPPQETVDLLAPHAFTTHIKDMGVEEYADGFLLAETPLGTGFLDLEKMVAALRQARPEIRLNLEMITRDPLKIPCLTAKYWATLDDVPGRRLAEMLALVRAKAGKKPLPRISDLSREEQLRREDDNVRQSLRYAKENLRA
ncbi:MAG TPA: TIM barrel protein [Gemmataceae bacterium]|nr:TIM barrel protein [Gemmataceae bacterium]